MSESSQRLRELDSFKRKLRMSPGGVLYDPLKFSLPDGDLAVLDDLMSFREYNNLMANFPGAGAIGNPQAGVIQYYSGTKLWKGYNGAAWVPVGKIAQVITDVYTTQATFTTGFPFDDTLPRRDEGDEIMACPITPQNASSEIIIMVTINGHTENDQYPLACLFRSDDMETIMIMTQDAAWNIGTKSMQWIESAGSTNVRIYSMRIGGKTGQNFYTNDWRPGEWATGKKSTLSIWEILP